MKRKTALTWSWLNVLTKKRYDVLCDVYGDLDAALEHVNEALLKSLGCKEETIYIVLNRLEEFDPSAYEKELERRSLQFISCEDRRSTKLSVLQRRPFPPLSTMYRTCGLTGDDSIR